MNNHKRLLATVPLLAVVLLLCASCQSMQTGVHTIEQRNAARGKQLFEQAYRDFVDERRDVVFITNLGYSPKANSYLGAYAGDWHVAALLHAGITVLHNYPNDRSLKRKVDFLFEYMNWFVQDRTDGYLVYAVSRGPAKYKAQMGSTAFDDQVYVAQVYFDGYMATGEQKYMDLLLEILRFLEDRGYFRGVHVHTGEEIGGYSWGEPFIGYLPICTTGPIAKIYLCLYEITEDPAKKAHYLEMAINTYDFIRRWDITTNGLLQNGIGWQHVSGNEYIPGLHDNMFHTYSNGFGIEVATRLYEITGEERYLEEAQFMALAARELFAVDISGYPEGLVQYRLTYVEGAHWFTMILFESYLRLAIHCDEGKRYVREFQDSLDYAYDNYYDRGYLPSNYITGWEPGWAYDEVKQILNVMAPVVMYSYLAR